MRKVIYADDHKAIREGVAMLMIKEIEGLDISLDFVEQGEPLVERVRAREYHLVFTDNSMPPGISGIEATRRIRSFNSTIPIILVCSDVSRFLGRVDGIQDYLEKGDLAPGVF